jgi:predicted amidohydrolase
MRELLASLLIMFLPVLLTAQDKPAAQSRPVVFRNVTLIDMRSEQPKPNMTVLISGNRIVKIGKNIKIPKNAEVVDASGKFLIPGLWDNYTFTLDYKLLAAKNNFPLFELIIAHGVTGVGDAGTAMDLADAAKLRGDVNTGRVLAPRLFYAGRVLTGREPSRVSARFTSNSRVVKTVEEARAAVESLARGGVDHIKAEKSLPPELLKEVISTAHKFNLPVVAVPQSFVLDAARDGLDCVEHMVEVWRTSTKQRDEYYALARGEKSMTVDEQYAFFGAMEMDLPYYKETLRTLARNRTFVATNNAQFDTFIGDFELFDMSRRRFKAKAQLGRLEAKISERERQIRNKDFRMLDSSRKTNLQRILDLQQAGVMLLAGTQLSSGSVLTPGLILHDELALFVRAGLSPFEALKTATVNPAIFMRREKDLGTIEKGKLADFILLDASPLADISNTRKINAVVVNGRYLSREVLDKVLSEAEAKAKSL